MLFLAEKTVNHFVSPKATHSLYKLTKNGKQLGDCTVNRKTVALLINVQI